MNNIIIKFKNSVKEIRIQQKHFLTQAQQELELIEGLVNRDEDAINSIDQNNIMNEFIIFKSFGATYLFKEKISKTKNILNLRLLKKETEMNDKKFEHIIKEFRTFVNTGKSLYAKTQSIINAFENDKIKEPINDLNDLVNYLRLAPLSTEEINTLLGMTIYFNNEYAQKNKNHKIKNIELIQKLSNYYNKDGTFKHNEDINTFKSSLNTLLEESISWENIPGLFLPTEINLNDLVNLLIESNKQVNNNIDNIQETNINTNIETIINEETKIALQELRKYYKNGSIIQIPENIEEFYKILELSGLDNYEIKYIKHLINNELEKNKKQINILTINEQVIYEKSINLINTLDYSNNDIYELKKLINELQDIFELSKLSTTKEDNEYLLNNAKNIINKLANICAKYEQQKISESTNRFIFLLDKDNTPYIHNDIDSLDPSYRKIIYSLIEKINNTHQQSFKKVLHQEKLPYNLMTVYSPKAYVAFVEISYNKYILIGANIARNGFKEIINRLLSNQNTIKDIENKIKNPEFQNNILTNNEQYIESIATNNNHQLTKKKVKKNK